jgi:hypothetical protein
MLAAGWVSIGMPLIGPGNVQATAGSANGIGVKLSSSNGREAFQSAWPRKRRSGRAACTGMPDRHPDQISGVQGSGGAATENSAD